MFQSQGKMHTHEKEPGHAIAAVSSYAVSQILTHAIVIPWGVPPTLLNRTRNFGLAQVNQNIKKGLAPIGFEYVNLNYCFYCGGNRVLPRISLVAAGGTRIILGAIYAPLVR